MGGYKWGHKSSNMGGNYTYPTYNPTYSKYKGVRRTLRMLVGS